MFGCSCKLPARIMILVSTILGENEKQPGPGMEGKVTWSMLMHWFTLICIRTARFSVQQ